MHRDRLLRDRYKFCVQNEANQKVFDLFKVNRRARVILNTCIISFTNLIERNVFFPPQDEIYDVSSQASSSCSSDGVCGCFRLWSATRYRSLSSNISGKVVDKEKCLCCLINKAFSDKWLAQLFGFQISKG